MKPERRIIIDVDSLVFWFFAAGLAFLLFLACREAYAAAPLKCPPEPEQWTLLAIIVIAGAAGWCLGWLHNFEKRNKDKR